MFRIQCHLAAAALTALGLTLANAGPEATSAGSGLTRAEVRQDLQQARATHRLTVAGEIGDSAAVLGAREAFNSQQIAVALGAEERTQQVLLKNQALDELIALLMSRDTEVDAVALVSDD